MMHVDRDALLCDLAETYGIYDFRALPVTTLATLAAGLRDDSRIKMHIGQQSATKTELLLAGILDSLHTLLWSMTKDGRNGINRPKSVLDALTGAGKEETPAGYRTADEFDRAWTTITGVSHHG